MGVCVWAEMWGVKTLTGWQEEKLRKMKGNIGKESLRDRAMQQH